MLRTHPLEIEVRKRRALSGFWVQSCFLMSENSVLIDLTTKSTKKLMVEPPAIVGLGPCSAAIRVVPYNSLFTSLELRAFKQWLVRWHDLVPMYF